MKRIVFLFGFILIIAGVESCKRYASVYQLRKNSFQAIDSVYWYDSTFFDQIFILDTLLEGRFNRNSFNGNVLCAYKGKVFYKRCIGWCDLSLHDTLQPHHSFQLASVSKPFTSTAILQLCEQGKLSLNDTLQKFFPDFPYKGITIKMLLCHRSGLPDYIKFTDKLYRRNPPESLTNDSVINLMYKLKPRAYSKPNQMYDYSNTGFMLLASIVESVTEQDFEDYVEYHIFKPCKMRDSYFYNLNKHNKRETSVPGYEDNEPVPESYLNGIVGDKGMYSTIDDLLKFDQAMRKGKILSKQWQDSAYTWHNPDWVGVNNYGLGWRLRKGNHDEQIVYHSGWWKGFRTLFVRDLTRDLTIVIFDNVRNEGFLFIDDLLWVFDNEKESIFF